MATPVRTAKSERTRAALVDAARKVFARDGFLDARIGDIAKEAALAHGSFYTHFSSKEEILAEVLLQVHHEAFELGMQRPGPEPADGGADNEVGAANEVGLGPAARIALTNRRFLDAYRRNAAVLSLLEQVASFKEPFAALRAQTRRAYFDRTAKGIRAWQAAGIVDPDVDAESVAVLLGGMVERYAYMQYTFGEGCADEDRALAAMNAIWVSALGLDEPKHTQETTNGATASRRRADR